VYMKSFLREFPRAATASSSLHLRLYTYIIHDSDMEFLANAYYTGETKIPKKRVEQGCRRSIKRGASPAHNTTQTPESERGRPPPTAHTHILLMFISLANRCAWLAALLTHSQPLSRAARTAPQNDLSSSSGCARVRRQLLFHTFRAKSCAAESSRTDTQASGII
jgi:hypothetical protein